MARNRHVGAIIRPLGARIGKLDGGDFPCAWGHDIETSSDAAKALQPIAGEFAFVVFALGIVGTGLLAVPVLAGSAAYALGETLQWRVGLAERPGRAPAFYWAIAAAVLTARSSTFRRSTLSRRCSGARWSMASPRSQSWS